MMNLDLLNRKLVLKSVNFESDMVEEIEALDKNEAQDLVEFLDGRKLIGSKWVFKKKLNATGKVEKYKPRLVAKGCSQVKGIDFGEMFFSYCKIDFH